MAGQVGYADTYVSLVYGPEKVEKLVLVIEYCIDKCPLTKGFRKLFLRILLVWQYRKIIHLLLILSWICVVKKQFVVLFPDSSQFIQKVEQLLEKWQNNKCEKQFP